MVKHIKELYKKAKYDIITKCERKYLK